MKNGLVVVALACLAAAPARSAPDKYHVTVEEHAACDNDAAAFCSDAYPDEDKLLACMKANRHQFKPLCQTTFEEGMRRRHLKM